MRINQPETVANPPRLKCRKVETLPAAGDWEAVEKAFAAADFAELGQAWTNTPDPGFQPARAAVIWNKDCILVFADLADREIYNRMPIENKNQLAIQHGDVFEVFLQPGGQEAYYELHVTPSNHQFQVRFPYVGAAREKPKKPGENTIENFKIWDHEMETRVRIMEQKNRWQATLLIPLSMIPEGSPIHPGDEWNFSFCRYDHYEEAPPVLSSTSPHREIDFHRLHEWGSLIFTSNNPA